eukprot:TRINITY_DN29747_c0_g1_i1.p1 TRINITY_DN29747_c0_g1~~TRINITY_DN29747_c0_g1_i1.p1  ORF type:complete len:354 (-),score=70.21 TRINITY_DN29747_c0_g1_i1:69-1130(-)
MPRGVGAAAAHCWREWLLAADGSCAGDGAAAHSGEASLAHWPLQPAALPPQLPRGVYGRRAGSGARVDFFLWTGTSGGGRRAQATAFQDQPGVTPSDGSGVMAQGQQDEDLDQEAMGNAFGKAGDKRKRRLLEWRDDSGTSSGFGNPCDKNGRMPSPPANKDGYTCHYWDACITALPNDFYRQTQWEGCLSNNPVYERGDKDLCSMWSGKPFCVPMDVLHRYGGPIEVDCKGSGGGVFLGPHEEVPTKPPKDQGDDDDAIPFTLPTKDDVRPKVNSTACWWMQKSNALKKTGGLVRLPGQILTYNQPQGWKVNKGFNGVTPLTDRQAYWWQKKGVLLDPVEAQNPRSAEFLYE